MRPEILDWFKMAEEDLKTAKALIREERFYASAFFSQQAAEKALKALHLKDKRASATTHSLLELCKQLGAPENIRIAAMSLSPHYIISRYPDAANGLPSELYNEESAKQRATEAGDIVLWARKKLF